jgi:thioredoxin reductase (NADPH)
MANAETGDNYPGFPDGISGGELAELMQKQAVKYGLETAFAEAKAITDEGDKKTIKINSGDVLARAVIIAAGSERVKLGAPGEEEFRGKGVSYCATCDGPLFRNKRLAVVGGGNTAVYEALHLAKFASKVSVIHRRDQLRATAVVQEKARAENKIEFIMDSVVKSIEGNDFVSKLVLENVKTKKQSALEVDGVFISIGLKPNTEFVKDMLTLDRHGRIVTDSQMKTSVAGILAAGDIRAGSVLQVSAAVGDGAVAAISAKKFIDGD